MQSKLLLLENWIENSDKFGSNNRKYNLFYMEEVFKMYGLRKNLLHQRIPSYKISGKHYGQSGK